MRNLPRCRRGAGAGRQASFEGRSVRRARVRPQTIPPAKKPNLGGQPADESCMKTQTTLDSIQALVRYAEREIEGVPAGSRQALVTGPTTETLETALARKGYTIDRSGSHAWANLDLVIAAGTGDGLRAPFLLERAILALNPEARLILATPELSHRLESRLRAAGFLVRIRALDAAAAGDHDLQASAAATGGTPFLYDAILVRRRQSRR